MALSDQLTALAARAKELEDHAAAARAKSKAEIEQQVKKARESAQFHADEFHTRTEKDKDQVSEWWHEVRTSWDDHFKDMRKHADERRAAHGLKSARRAADRAEADAELAVDFAYAAVVDAEYSVLDAVLARMQYDDLAGVETD